MKVLLSAYACEPHRGSELGNGWNWALHLAMEGHKVTVLTRVHGRDAIESELSRLNRGDLHVIYVDVPAWTKLLFRGQVGVFAHYFLWQRMALRSARRMSLAPDIVHHVTWGSLQGGSFLGSLRKPFVFGPLGGGQVAPSSFSRYWGRSWSSEFRRTLVTRYVTRFNPLVVRALRSSDKVLATNSDTLELAKKLGARDVRLFLDSGLPEDYFPDMLPVRAINEIMEAVWVGRLYPRKALRIALEAMTRVSVPVHLSVYGDGPQGVEVGQWIHELDLTDRVTWHGQVTWNELRGAYRKADIFLFTSLRDSFGSQMLEAMAWGLPMIVLDHHGARDMLPPQTAIKIPVDSAENVVTNIALSIDRLYSDQRLRESIGLAGREYAKLQVWSERARSMTVLYEQVVSR